MEVKVSIAVPAYEHFDRGVEFLDDLFRTISIQTLKEVEVVVSDHSTEDNVEKFTNIAAIAFVDSQLRFYKGQMEDYIADQDAGELVTPDGSPIDTKLTTYMRLQQRYRRLTPSQRADAWQNLPSLIRDGGLTNQEPNLGDPEHLFAMIEFALAQP